MNAVPSLRVCVVVRRSHQCLCPPFFRVRGSQCTLSQTATRRRGVAAAPIPKGETVCTSPRTHSVPTSSSVDTGLSRATLSPLGPLRVNLSTSLVTLWVKMRLRSCQPLRDHRLHRKTSLHSLCQRDSYVTFHSGWAFALNSDERDISLHTRSPRPNLLAVGWTSLHTSFGEDGVRHFPSQKASRAPNSRIPS